MGQPIDEVRRQLSGAHLILRDAYRVFDPVEFDPVSIVVPYGKARANIAIARLPYRTRIDKQLLPGVTPDSDELIEFKTGCEAGPPFVIGHKNHGKVTMAEKGDSFICQ